MRGGKVCGGEVCGGAAAWSAWRRATLVDVEHLVVGAFVDEHLVRVERLLEIAQVEGRVGEPHRALRVLHSLLFRQSRAAALHPLEFAASARTPLAS